MSKYLIYKFAFGIVAPFIGLFAGLQISPWLGNILMFPFITISALTGIPIGEMPGLLFAVLVLVSGVAWAAILSLPNLIRSRRGKNSQAD